MSDSHASFINEHMLKSMELCGVGQMFLQFVFQRSINFESTLEYSLTSHGYPMLSNPYCPPEY